MAYEIDVYDETDILSVEHVALAEDILHFAMKRFKLDAHTECSLLFVAAGDIQALNREYRGRDQVTDVLSFALNDEEQAGVDAHVLGDIVICVDKLYEQAAEYSHSNERELCFLTIHGFLHLLGYDHETSEEETEMFALQEEVLRAYGMEREQ